MAAEELGARFLRPKDVLKALCSVAVQLAKLQTDNESLGKLVGSDGMDFGYLSAEYFSKQKICLLASFFCFDREMVLFVVLRFV